MARKYSSTSTDTTLSTTLGSSATSCTVVDAVDLMGGVSLGAGDTFTVALAPDTAAEEIVLVTNVSSNTLTITRAQAGTTAQTHEAGTTVRHVLTSLELSEFATQTGTETLTNKTLTAPKFADLGFIADANGNELIVMDTTASAVNEIKVANAATGGNPTIAATGGDTNISLNIVAKGSGTVQVGGVPVVTTTDTQTLTNKTLTTPVISTISNTGTVTLPTATDTLVGRATTDTLTNKTIALGSNTVSGTIAQFNTAVTDADFATLTGTETLTNKNVRLAGVDEKTANYTLVAGDAGKLISVNSSSNLTVTVPSGVFSVGDIIYVTRTGTGTVTIAASGTTLTSADSNLKLRARYSAAAIICIASNTFRVVGDLTA